MCDGENCNFDLIFTQKENAVVSVESVNDAVIEENFFDLIATLLKLIFKLLK